MYFPSALCLRSGSAEGFTVPAVLGWRWGYTQDVYFVHSWGQTKKWKKMPRTFLKNNPCDLTMKKNKKTTTAKRNIQCQSPRARQTWRLWNMKFKVRTLKLQFQAQKLGNYNFIYIFSCSKDWHANWRSGLTCAKCKAVEDFSRDKMPRGLKRGSWPRKIWLSSQVRFSMTAQNCHPCLACWCHVTSCDTTPSTIFFTSSHVT